MEKPTKIPYKANDSIKEELVPQRTISYNKDSNTISIMSLVDATVKITGTVTGQLYVFGKSGAIVSVDKKDADEILNKKRGNSCCGGQSGKSVFVRA